MSTDKRAAPQVSREELAAQQAWPRLLDKLVWAEKDRDDWHNASAKYAQEAFELKAKLEIEVEEGESNRLDNY